MNCTNVFELNILVFIIAYTYAVHVFKHYNVFRRWLG